MRIGYVTKKSCRACGRNMITVAVCGVCKEHISWRCSRCSKMEAATHVHNYGRPVYKEATANSCQSHLGFSTGLM